MKKKPTHTETDVAAPSGALRPGRGLVNTVSSSHVRLRSVNMSDVQKWNDKDFYKWLEATTYVYGMIKDVALDHVEGV